MGVDQLSRHLGEKKKFWTVIAYENFIRGIFAILGTSTMSFFSALARAANSQRNIEMYIV